ncbi:MAG: cupin domain-containing protein [Candidatus Acidiferrales bacterium]
MSDSAKPAQSSAIRTPGSLESSILSFDLNAETERLRREEAWQAGRNSKTLVKYPDFRVVLVVLKTGARMPDHKAAGSISVQTITGHIQMHIGSELFDLPAGRILTLEPEILHDVEALEDSGFLLTIAWPQNTSGS